MKKDDVLCVPNKAFKFSPTEITGGKKYKEQGIWIIKIPDYSKYNAFKKLASLDHIAKDLSECDIRQAEQLEGQ